MQRLTLILLILLSAFIIIAKEKDSGIYIDNNGIMRWKNNKKEASFFGVNYTLPFAHAYRAINYLNKDHKEAIDKDVYHMARLGFNAYRIHIWDVEISDENGNLLENTHLDLLDYLIYKLKERNISIVLTAMTNFGNGYPERNQKTEGFSYLYSKCDIHDNPQAIAAQENYIYALVKHINPYTKKAYMHDPDIMGFEINNEPCHAGTQTQTKEYIGRMLAALQKAGNKKPVFYNVSHNMQQIEAYYSTEIQGTTYQWYPIGLVAGRTRHGNFLPYVDKFNIPFNKTKGFNKMAKLVYEYDPADNNYSYIHPAIVRSFRSAGFQWITQFAYDPIDIAQYNTEYQTHYLNLAYTPQKAISMKIAAEAAYTLPRNKTYGIYPNDTIFNDFRVSYEQDLSELNNPKKYFYSNHTTSKPIAENKLESIAGYGNSPIVIYEGTGAYFIDKLENGLWRLEVMPDVVQVNDPFAKPSLNREVNRILWNNWNMSISLTDLGKDFRVKGINEGNNYLANARENTIQQLYPGVYLLQRKETPLSTEWEKSTKWNTITIGEYVAPKPSFNNYTVHHESQKVIERNKPLTIQAQIAGPDFPDSVLVYTDKVSFWNDHNPSFIMRRAKGYTYEAIIPSEQIKGNNFRYNIIVCRNDKQFTFPGNITGNPLDWNYIATNYWESSVVDAGSAIKLFSVSDEYSGMEAYSIPESHKSTREIIANNMIEEQTMKFSFTSEETSPAFFLRKYIKDKFSNRQGRLMQCKEIVIHLKHVKGTFQIGFITNKGTTYQTPVSSSEGVIRIPISELKQTFSALLPHSYPTFLDKYFIPENDIPFYMQDIETLEIRSTTNNKDFTIEFGSIWLE